MRSAALSCGVAQSGHRGIFIEPLSCQNVARKAVEWISRLPNEEAAYFVESLLCARPKTSQWLAAAVWAHEVHQSAGKLDLTDGQALNWPVGQIVHGPKMPNLSIIGFKKADSRLRGGNFAKCVCPKKMCNTKNSVKLINCGPLLFRVRFGEF